MIGQTLNNRYKVTDRLGKGAMGTVYRATDMQTGQEVALKSIAIELAFDPEMLERFRREGEALRQLKHPNIVGFIDTFQYEDTYVIVMEYVSGGSLFDLIKAGRLPIEKARQITLDLCDALIRAHRLNIIHRDLKPENILMDEDGTPKLADFGVARLSEGTRMTRSGTQVGTPYYMAPEAWEGIDLDAQADIWSLGVILFEMLSGQVPFSGDTGVAVMNKVLTAAAPDLKKLRAEVPLSFAQINKKMITRDKKYRYQSVRQLAADLERDQLVVNKLPKSAGMFTEKINSRLMLYMLGGMGLIILISSLFWIIRNQIIQSTQDTMPTNTASPGTDIPVSILGGTLLFEEDFEDGKMQGIGFSAEAGWEFATDETGNKVYEIDNRNGSAYRGFSFGAAEWEDYSVEYQARFLGSTGNQSELGLQIRSYDNTYYVLVFGEEESYLAYSINGSGWTRLNTQFLHIERGIWQNVRVVVQGEQISVYLNDVLFINAKSSQIRVGEAMIFVGANTSAQVDNIRVVTIGDEQSTSITPQSTPTDIPNSTYLLREDFEDGKADDWLSVNDGIWSIFDDNGNTVYGVSDQSADYIPIAYYSESGNWENYAFETEFIFESGRLEQIWLNVRTGAANCTGYSIGGNRYGLQIFRLDPRSTCQSETLAELNYPLVGGRRYKIRVEAQGSEIRAYMDDELVMTATDNTYPRGGINLAAYEVKWAYFDNVRVWELKSP